MQRCVKALMILTRYLIKEVLTTLLAVTFVLLLIFLSNWLVRYLDYAASGKIASGIVLQLLGFEIPSLLAVLLPLGLFLGVILAYGRLYSESEMRVMHACGFTLSRLFLVTSYLAITVAVGVLIFMLWINPWVAAKKEKVLTNNGAGNVLAILMPGRFQSVSDGRRVVYVEKMSRDRKQATNIFMADQVGTTLDESSKWVVLSASKGYQQVDPATQDRFIVAEDGARYEGVPGQNDYKIVQFKKYAVKMPETATTSSRAKTESIPTQKLLETYHNPENAAELQWRISIALSAILLGLLAVPLSQVKPRKSRYSMVLPAILVYAVYVNLLFAARNLVEQQIISVTIGMWWVHLIVLGLLGLFLLTGRRTV